MQLSGRQIERIHEALLDAFASRDALRMLVRIELEQNLDAIAGGENLRVVVFNLVNWAEQTGRVLDLIQGAFKQNQGNAKLQALVRDAQEWLAPPSSPPAAPEAPLRAAGSLAAPASIDVFLSYSRKDEAIMRQVQDSLRGAGLSVWIDEGLEPGTVGWQEAIAEAIDQAQVMVVLLSPASTQSPWVKNEISFAQSRGKRICPVLVAGDTGHSVPIGLINVQWVDGREDLRQALDQQLLPSLRRTLSSPEEPADVVSPAAKAETVVPDGPPAPQPKTRTGQPRETIRRKRAPAWIVLVMSVIAVGAVGYFVIGLLQFPAFRPLGTPDTTAATDTVAAATKPSAPAAGDIWTNPKDGAEYVFIPAGTFMMGSAADDRLANDDERPQHSVTLDGYWIMRTEVTNQQYKRCVDAGDCTPPDNSEYDKKGFEMRPVTHVDWRQANAYAEWVGGRLPTEAEWEYACRGGDGRIYPWDNRPPSKELLNYNDNIGHTTDVGSYPAGANDLFDMAGNVWEWTADWYGETYYSESPEQNPPGPRDGDRRVLRGGSFDYFDIHVRCAFRGWSVPDLRYFSLAFRVMSPGS